MKIFLTGSKGFIGRYLKQAFDQRGYETTEVSDYTLNCPPVDGYDLVVHVGAISATTERNVDKILQCNLDFSQRLFIRCQQAGIPMQYASSASVYGDINRPAVEHDPVDPRSPYAWSKYLFDRWVDHQSKTSPVQGFRYFNVYGNKESLKGPMASPYTKFHLMAESQQVIELFEGSDQFTRDFVCVEDVVDVHLRFIDQQVKESGVWNVGSGQSVSFGAVARAVQSKYPGTEISMIPIPPEVARQYQKFTQAVNTKLLNTVNKDHWIDITQYIKQTQFER